MPELDRRVSPSSPPDAMRALGRFRSWGGSRRHLRNRAARLHASLYAKQHPALHVVVEQLAGTTLDQRCDRPEQRPDDRDLPGEWLEPAAVGPGDQAGLETAGERLKDQPLTGDQAARPIDHRDLNGVEPGVRDPVAYLQILPLRVDAGRRMTVCVGDEQQALDPLMGIEAGPPGANLGEPRPDLFGWWVDRD